MAHGADSLRSIFYALAANAAIFFLSMGGLFSMCGRYHKLRDPEPLKSPLVALLVLLFSLGANPYRSGAVSVRSSRNAAPCSASPLLPWRLL